MGLFKSLGKSIKKVGSAVGKVAKSVGKVAGKALQVVGPVASMIPGVGTLVGKAANIVGGILSPSGGEAPTQEIPASDGGVVEVPAGAAVGYQGVNRMSGGGGNGGIAGIFQKYKMLILGGCAAVLAVLGWKLLGKRRRF